jgi:hypothetical protein
MDEAFEAWSEEYGYDEHQYDTAKCGFEAGWLLAMSTLEEGV